MQEQFATTEIGGVQVITDAGDTVERLKLLRSAIQSDKRRTVLVRRLSDDDEKVNVIAEFEVLIPIVDEYVLMYQHDEATENKPDNDYGAQLKVEQESAKDKPRRVLPSYLHIDVPYTYAESASAALRTAWRSVKPGDRMIVLAPDAERIFTALRAMSQSVEHDPKDATPPRPERDENTGGF